MERILGLGNEAEQASRASPADLSFQGARVLVIDDQLAALEAALAYLADRGLAILVAPDGAGGLEQARDGQPDLILLAGRMPGLDGFETCRRLKANDSTSQIPVIFMIPLAEIEDKVTAFAAGGVDYLTRPLQLEELVARLHTHLALRRLQQQREARTAQLQQEIAGRERIQEALTAERNLLRTVIDNLPDYIFVKDRESRFMFANKGTVRRFGVATAEELIGKTDFDFLPADTVAPFYASEQELFHSGQPILEREELNTDFGGVESWFLTTKVPLRDSEGQIIGLVGITRNITERKRLEEALEKAHIELERRVKLRTLELSQANEKLTQEEAKIQRRNRELALLNQVIAASVSETEAEAILEITCRELALTFDVPQAAAALLNPQKTEAVVVAEYRLSGHPSGLGAIIRVDHEPSGQYLVKSKVPLVVDDARTDPRLADFRNLLQRRGTVSLLLVPLVIDGEVIGSLGLDTLEPRSFSAEEANLAQSVASQVSGVLARLRLDQERQRLETRYHQAQKMEALGRLTGGVAHDFNNLLTVILGHTSLIREKLGESHLLRHDVDQIQKATERAATLVRQLLAFSRQQILQPRVLNLNDIVTNIEKMLRRLIGEDIDLVIKLEARLGQVKADFGQLEQVLVNLAVNARDAMPEGGKLMIETANVYLDRAYARQHVDVVTGPYVMLTVTDTGLGMDAETQAHIFEPFFTTKEQGKGTGLGLATVHGIITQSGGHIGLYTEPGHGTTFKIYLPQVEAKAELSWPNQVAAEAKRGWETILLVEDEEMVRELARRTLANQGYTILVAQDGKQARQICAAHQDIIHLMLTDVIIPGGMNGAKLAKELVSLRPGMKVLYMSGYTENAIVHQELLDPNINFLPKPFKPNDLIHKVREVLDGGKKTL